MITTCSPCRRTHTGCPASSCGTAYCPPSKVTSDRAPALAGHAQRSGKRRGRDGVQPGPLLGQHLGRGPGDPVRPGVDLVAEPQAGASSAAKLAYSSRRLAHPADHRGRPSRTRHEPQLPGPHQPDQPPGKLAGLLREAGHDPVIRRGAMGAKARAAALASL